MARPNRFIRLSPQAETELQAFLKQMLREDRLGARRRGQAILFSHQGWTIPQIVKYLRINERNVRKWFKTYQQKGLEGLKGKYVYKRLG